MCMDPLTPANIPTKIQMDPSSSTSVATNYKDEQKNINIFIHFILDGDGMPPFSIKTCRLMAAANSIVKRKVIGKQFI